MVRFSELGKDRHVRMTTSHTPKLSACKTSREPSCCPTFASQRTFHCRKGQKGTTQSFGVKPWSLLPAICLPSQPWNSEQEIRGKQVLILRLPFHFETKQFTRLYSAYLLECTMHIHACPWLFQDVPSALRFPARQIMLQFFRAYVLLLVSCSRRPSQSHDQVKYGQAGTGCPCCWPEFQIQCFKGLTSLHQGEHCINSNQQC